MAFLATSSAFNTKSHGGKSLPNNSKDLALKIADLLDNKKAIDIVVLDVSALTVITDYFVIASGRSELQVKTLCDELEKKLQEEEIHAAHKDGRQGARWIALDYGSVIVHLFHHEERAFYNLERLWMDGKRL